MDRLDRVGGEPLWRQLREDLLRRVEAGEFTDAFPGEMALVAEYGVSRHTVRQALQQLRHDGVVLAGRGRQPRVAPLPEIAQPVGALYSLFASVEEAGLDQRSVVQAFDVRADALVAERLGLEASAPLVYLARLRMAGDAPLALDRVWLPASVASSLVGADFARTSLYGELATRAGVRINHGLEEIRVAVPTAAERTQLKCPRDVGAFSINRLGFVGDQKVEWRHTLVRGDRFALTATYSANAGYLLKRSGDGLQAQA
jgi:GntR family transcriptional regulator